MSTPASKGFPRALKDLYARVEALEAAAGVNPAASDVTTSPIAGVTGTNVQEMLSSLKTLLDGKADNA